MCLDQNDDGTPCPGCRDDLERRYKFWCRVIEREAEIENDAGKVTGYEDQGQDPFRWQAAGRCAEQEAQEA